MDSKRKANGNAIALEDVDDRAVKRRKMPVSFALFFDLCGAYIGVEMRYGSLHCAGVSIAHFRGSSTLINAARPNPINPSNCA